MRLVSAGAKRQVHNFKCTMMQLPPLVLHLKHDHLQLNGARVLYTMIAEDGTCRHWSRNSRPCCNRHNLRRVQVSVRVDGDFIARDDVDEMIAMIVENIWLIFIRLWRYCEQDGLPVIILCDALIEVRVRGTAIREITDDIARGAMRVSLYEQDLQVTKGVNTRAQHRIMMLDKKRRST